MALIKSICNRLFVILLTLDQLVCGVIWLRPDHTISGEVGYAAMQGKRWGLAAEVIIDGGPDKMLSVAYGNMVGLLIEGIKELSAKNTALEARLADLEAHIA